MLSTFKHPVVLGGGIKIRIAGRFVEFLQDLTWKCKALPKIPRSNHPIQHLASFSLLTYTPEKGVCWSKFGENWNDLPVFQDLPWTFSTIQDCIWNNPPSENPSVPPGPSIHYQDIYQHLPWIISNIQYLPIPFSDLQSLPSTSNIFLELSATICIFHCHSVTFRVFLPLSGSTSVFLELSATISIFHYQWPSGSSFYY